MLALLAAAVVASGAILATEPTLPAVGGTVALLVTFAGYLLRELNRSSGGAWRVTREKNREIHRLRWEVAHWQHAAGVGPDPGLYVPPTDEELRTW